MKLNVADEFELISKLSSFLSFMGSLNILFCQEKSKVILKETLPPVKVRQELMVCSLLVICAKTRKGKKTMENPIYLIPLTFIGKYSNKKTDFLFS